MDFLDKTLKIAKDDFLSFAGETDENLNFLETLSFATENPQSFKLKNSSLDEKSQVSKTMSFKYSIRESLYQDYRIKSDNDKLQNFLLELLSDDEICSLLSDEDAQKIFQILFFERICKNKFFLEIKTHKNAVHEDTKNVLDLALIDHDRKEDLEFIKNNLEKILAYFKMLKALGFNPLPDCFGRGYGDLFDGNFSSSDYEVLDDYVSFMKSQKDLQELAQKIGHHASSFRQNQKEHKPAVAYDGIHLDSELKSLLPSELVLHQNELTRTEFLRRFTEKQLQCYQNAPDNSGSGNKNQKGPVIICLDTSGSMEGTPEKIAKAITLALIQVAAEENRPLYIISFSVEYESIVIKNPSELGEMERILSFLKMSFYGGTDICPAFCAACTRLDDECFCNADVLMVSDFLTPPLDEKTKSKINFAKQNGTVFYALEVGERGVQYNVLDQMDEIYRYKNGIVKL